MELRVDMKFIMTLATLILFTGGPNSSLSFPTERSETSATTIESATEMSFVETQETLSTLNIPTTSSNDLLVEETTVTTQRPEDEEGITIAITSKSQEEVLHELQDLWHFSEDLNDTNTALKSSLFSIVHLAYARVYTEPDETLHKLKNLLKLLKTRLSGESGRRHKRSFVGAGDVENIILSSAEEINSIDSQGLKDKNGEAPSEAVVQKILNVKDRFPGQEEFAYMNILTSKAPLRTTMRPSAEETLNVNEGISTTEGKPMTGVTADQIANAILKLLYPALKNASSSLNLNFSSIPNNASHTVPLTTTTTSTIEPNQQILPASQIFHSSAPSPAQSIIQSLILELITAKPIHYPHQTQNPSQSMKYSTKKKHIENIDRADINETNIQISVPVPTIYSDLISTTKPPHFQPFQWIRTTTESEPLTIVDYFIEEIEDEIPTTTPITSSSHFQYVIDELAEADLNPSVIVNETIAGISGFLSSFNTLSSSTKLILLFALSIGVLSIVLGIYTFAPPITAFGILGIVIPIVLLFLLQNQNQRARQKLGKKLLKNDEEIVHLLDLIFKSIDKYTAMHHSHNTDNDYVIHT